MEPRFVDGPAVDLMRRSTESMSNEEAVSSYRDVVFRVE